MWCNPLLWIHDFTDRDARWRESEAYPAPAGMGHRGKLIHLSWRMFSFHCKSLFIADPREPYDFVFSDNAAIQNGWQHTQIGDWPKLVGVWFFIASLFLWWQSFLWLLEKAAIQITNKMAVGQRLPLKIPYSLIRIWSFLSFLMFDSNFAWIIGFGFARIKTLKF